MPRRSKVNLSKTFVKNAKAPDPSGKQVCYWDESLTGFGLLCSGKTNAKSFVVQRGKVIPRRSFADANVMSVEEARETARDMLLTIGKGKDPTAEDMTKLTVKQAMEKLIAKPGLAEKSQENYRYFIETYFDDWLEKPLLSLTRTMIVERHDKITLGKRKGQRKPAPGSANSAVVALRTAYNFCSKQADEPFPPNPAVIASMNPTNKRTGHVPSDKMKKFWKAAGQLENPVQAAFVKLLMTTGLRSKNAKALRWEEVDLEGGVIHLPGTKTTGAIPLPLNSLTIEVLKKLEALGRDESGWVFPANSKSGHIAEPKYPLALIAEKTGITITPHDLRRTFTTAAGTARLTGENTQARLVHHKRSSGTVTGDYDQTELAFLKGEAEKVGKVLRKRIAA